MEQVPVFGCKLNMTSNTDLFHYSVSPSTPRNVVRITYELFPRLFRWRLAHWPQREESEVTVGHVVILSAEQKPSGHRELGVTIDDHCVTSRPSTVLNQGVIKPSSHRRHDKTKVYCHVGGVNCIGDKSKLSPTENLETVLSGFEMR